MRKIKLVVHDWDDTITNSFETYLSWYGLFAEYFSLEAPDLNIVQRAWGDTVPGIVCAVWPQLKTNDIEYMVEEFALSESYRKADFIPKPFNGMPETFKKLKSYGYILGVLSSGRRSSVEAAYKKYINTNMAEYHDFIITQHESKYFKPDPKVFDSVRAYMKRGNLSFDEVLYVGDNLIDFEMSLNVGIDFIATLTGLNSLEDFLSKGLKEDKILESFAVLPQCLINSGNN